MDDNSSHKTDRNLQLAWGVVLALTGVAVFFRIPEVLPELVEKLHFASGKAVLGFCLYLMGVMLVGGGAKKIYAYFRSKEDQEKQAPGPGGGEPQ